ncbi:EAL domain-containing protein [Actimicrobium sp. CCC2.4]|uniref:EAL domain-containing protein n=1 Tax=Actimicrobium sp. CCC2.4 TaxID=3048606 RepID=UPI002AC8CDBE|nr:EAL domain-containing protein [Actimicrobium sp. CCC2.4]MEB0135028.1 EAL domain-containing protein [Actimicrobium sp. CCC2.4]WPX31924.1 EAL domain-containing protein [Actimicrobium sp. CCC2.4]
MTHPLRILLLEDVATEAELILRALRRAGLVVEAVRVETRADFVAQLAHGTPDVILSDFSLPNFDGLSALALATASHPAVPFIFISGTIGEDTAIEALKRGAIDYLLKTNLQRLPSAVLRAIDEARGRAARLHAESRFRDLIEYAPHAIVVFDQRGCIDIVNAQAEALFGYPRSAMLGTDGTMLATAAFPHWHTALPDSKAAPGSSISFEVIARRGDGSCFPAEVSLSPLQTVEGRCISSVIRDLSERKAQEERLARMTRIRTILGSINSVILRVHDKQMLLDAACRIAHEQGRFASAIVGLLDPVTLAVKPVAWAGVDPAFLEILDFSADETLLNGQGLVGRALRSKRGVVSNDLQHDDPAAPMRDEFLQRGYRAAFVVPLMIGQQAFGVLALLSCERDAFNEEEQHLLAELAADISFSHAVIDKEEQINYLAYFDALTGLPNRALFLDRVALLLPYDASVAAERIALVLIDVERFHHINDTYGRAAGDEVLRLVAQRLRDHLPDAGYLARIGADSFAFVLKDYRSETDVVHLLEGDLASALGEPLHMADKSISLSVRAGIALFPNDGSDSDSLLRNAEAAMKDARAAKVRYLFYTTEMNARTAEKLSLENRLRRALAEQQFVLHYQPKVDLRSGRIAGMEALIRWDEPGVGLVSPFQFIQVLEDTGLIVEVGIWVIAEAHRQCVRWQEQGLVVPRIAVNVSQLQIREKDFVARVLAIQVLHPCPQLEIEITESLFMDDAGSHLARDKLVALREAGMTVAIDDFGTGYSSLGYLARLPIDTLKIDRSFINAMTTSAEHLAIVTTIISLAHALKLHVVAEGVETAVQRDQLTQMGCDQMQGFLFSPGVRAEVMAGMLETG